MVRDLLHKTPFFNPLRDTYLRLFKHRYWQRRIADVRNFYRQFVPEGSLVFDVGANRGEHTRAFLSLGARVVAVEPNPELVTELRKIWHKHLTVAPYAVGERDGTLPMHLSSVDLAGSLSRDWVDAVSRAQRFSETHWERQIDVPVTTLDALIAHYGMPHFIKIDVEGFELQVLRGLTQMPSALSFEFTEEYPEAVQCLQQPCIPRDALCNYVRWDETNWQLPAWIPHSDMVKIANFPGLCYGNLAVRRRS